MSAASLFVSYSRDDRHALPPVIEVLQQLGFQTWWDKELHAGRHLDVAIETAMRSSDAVLALWSPAYVRTGSYTEKEWSFATQNLAKPTAAVLIEPVRPSDLGIVMSRLKVPGPALSQLADWSEAPGVIAGALAEAGVRPPNGIPSGRGDMPDYAAQMIDPTFDRLCAMDDGELRQVHQRLQRILAGNPGSPYHSMNAALVWLHTGNPTVAADLAQRALAARPDSGEISYFAALVATAMAPLSRGPREAASAIFDLARRSTELGYDRSHPYLLQSAIAHEYFECNGMAPPVKSEAALRKAYEKTRDAAEIQRLFKVLKASAPSFFVRFA